MGAGLTGQSWAALFASKGCSVVMQDTSERILAQARKQFTAILTMLEKGGVIGRKRSAYARTMLRTTTDLSEAVGDAEYVQESIYENYRLKQAVFKRIEKYASRNAILASSTSGLLISKIQERLEGRERCLIAHPFNPVHLIPLVELVPGRWTSRKTIDSVYDFMLSIGKVPIKVAKELSGHVANRLTAALWREAIDMLIRGVASAEDIDRACKYGPGLRWAVQGPFLSYHLGGGPEGIDWFVKQLTPSFELRWKTLATWTKLPKDSQLRIVRSVRNMTAVKNDSYNVLIRRRDEQLMELLRIGMKFSGKQP